MTDGVPSGLVERQATPAGELEASQARSRQIHADLASLDAYPLSGTRRATFGRRARA